MPNTPEAENDSLFEVSANLERVPQLTLIAALARNRVIGRDNGQIGRAHV